MQSYKKRLEKNLNLFYLTSFFSGMIFVLPIWVAFERQFLDFTYIALLEAIISGTTTFLELPTGALADLLGRRKTLMIGSLLLAIGNISFAFCANFSHFLLSTIIAGAGSALISGSDIALGFDTLKELGREKDFSKFKAKNSLFFRTAFFLATLAGGYLYRYWQQLPFILHGSSQIIIALIIFFMIEPRIDSEKFNLKNYVIQTKKGFAQIFKSSYMKKLTLFYTIIAGISWSAGIYFEQAYALELGFTDIERSWIFSIVLLSASVLSFILIENEDKYITRNRVYLGFPLVLSIALLSANFVPKFLVPLTVFFLVRFTLAMRFSILDKYTNMEFESKYRATAVSALNMLVSLVYLIVVGTSGKFQDLYGTGVIYLTLGIITVLLAFPSGLSLVKEYKAYKSQKASKNAIL